MKKYIFPSLDSKKHDIKSFVKWCKEMQKLHPHYDKTDLMIWGYVAGVSGYLFQDPKKNKRII